MQSDVQIDAWREREREVVAIPTLERGVHQSRRVPDPESGVAGEQANQLDGNQTVVLDAALHPLPGALDTVHGVMGKQVINPLGRSLNGK